MTQEKYGEAIGRLWNALVTSARRAKRSHAEAEDAVQQAAMELLARADLYSDDAAVKAALYARLGLIRRREARSWARRRDLHVDLRVLAGLTGRHTPAATTERDVDPVETATVAGHEQAATSEDDAFTPFRPLREEPRAVDQGIKAQQPDPDDASDPFESLYGQSSVEDVGDDPLTQAIRLEDKAAALAALPANVRPIIELFERGEIRDEVAAALGITLDALDQRLSRLRKSLVLCQPESKSTVYIPRREKASVPERSAVFLAS